MRHPRDRTVYSFHLQFVGFLFPFETFSREKQRILGLTNFKVSLFDQRIKVNIKLETSLYYIWLYKLLTRWYYKIENIGGWKGKTRALLLRSVRPIASISQGSDSSRSSDGSWCSVAKTPVHMPKNLRSVGLKIVEKRWQNPVSRVDELIGLHECIPALIVAFLGHDT